MRQWLRSHLTYANVMVTILAFLVLGGGTALGAYVVSSNSQVGPGTISGHRPPIGKHSNIIANSITGKDIADRSGVDTCNKPLVRRFGPICEGSDSGSRTWFDASNYCTQYGLRLPTVGEALAMARKYVVDGVSKGQEFWTDDLYVDNNTLMSILVVDKAGPATFVSPYPYNLTAKTVCVTDPS